MRHKAVEFWCTWSMSFYGTVANLWILQRGQNVDAGGTGVREPLGQKLPNSSHYLSITLETP